MEENPARSAVASHTRPLRQRRSRSTRDIEIAGWVCAAPWFVGFFVFAAGPMIASLYLSLTNYSILEPGRFIGFENYRAALGDPLVLKSLVNTAYMVFVGVPVRVVASLLVAILLNAKLRGITFFRTMFYTPHIIPPVANSILWVWILNSRNGLLNYTLGLMGIRGPNWFSVPFVKPAMIIMSLWGIGGGSIIFLAGLQGVPDELYEASEIDGATAWAKFRFITIPLLTPVLFFTLVTGVVGTMQMFTEGYVMTGGGPLDASLFYVLYLFNHAFRYLNMGYACALAWILFALILGLTILQLKLARRWVYY